MKHTSILMLATALLGICATQMARAEDAKLVQSDDAYFKRAKADLDRILAQKPNTNRAKNVILIIGDGMSIPTVTAGRIFDGQQKGVDGAMNKLSFEQFPYSALSRTFSHDNLVTDSAPSAAAMLSGVKQRNNVIGIRPEPPVRVCGSSKGQEVTTLAEMAKTLGMSAGAVSTARITDATPAAIYVHSAARQWESDANLPEEAVKNGCVDIARQLVEFKYGDGLDVMIGGGRQAFIPATMADPEYAEKTGKRKDGKDLTKAWLERYSNSGAYVWNAEQFAKVDPANTRHLLGLFEPEDMQYEADRKKDRGGEPSLAEMSEKAIDILSKNPNGYFLMIEGGRVDHGNHANNAYRTMTDLVAMNEAVKKVLAKVNLDDTLVIVTADHSHTLTIQGYPDRDTNILGLVKEGGKISKADDGKPYTVLSFTNGPGGKRDGSARADLSNVDTTDPDFVQQALIPLSSETHSGEDVAIFATGPWAHLFQGVVDENYIFFVMDYALQTSARLEKK